MYLGKDALNREVFMSENYAGVTGELEPKSP